MLSWVLRGAGAPPGRDCRAGQHPSNRPSAISIGCRAGEDPGRLPAAGQAVCAEQVQQLQGSPYSKQGVNSEEDCSVQLRSPMKQLLSSAQAAGLQQAWLPNYPSEQLLTPGMHGGLHTSSQLKRSSAVGLMNTFSHRMPVQDRTHCRCQKHQAPQIVRHSSRCPVQHTRQPPQLRPHSCVGHNKGSPF